jgi:hypothetical protein
MIFFHLPAAKDNGNIKRMQQWGWTTLNPQPWCEPTLTRLGFVSQTNHPNILIIFPFSNPSFYPALQVLPEAADTWSYFL